MANTNAPYGLLPANLDGSAATVLATNTYYVSSSSTVPIFRGDPVVLTGTGDADGIPGVIRASAGSSLFIQGICVGVVPTTNASTVYREPSTARYLLVCDDPNQLYSIQSNGTSAITAIGANANLAAGTGGTATGVSGFTLNESTVNTTAALQLRIVRSDPSVNNEIGLYGRYLVRVNLNQKTNLTGVQIMAIINTGSFPAALKPGVFEFAQLSYDMQKDYIPLMFNEQPSTYAYEDIVASNAFGVAQVKGQGQAIAYDTENQAYTTRATNVTYALGFAVTLEEIEDNIYSKVTNGRAGRLGEAFVRTRNIVGANVYNRAFNSSYSFGDGKELIATDHPTISGNQSNELAVAAPLSEAAIEDLCIQIKNATDNRGNKIAIQPKRLVIPTALTFDADRILKSELQNDSANNAINALRNKGSIPETIDNTYLTSSDAWFIQTDTSPTEGLIYFKRKGFEMWEDVDAATTNQMFYARERYVFTCGDFRAIYGTQGASQLKNRGGGNSALPQWRYYAYYKFS